MSDRSRVVIEGRLASDGTRSTVVFQAHDNGSWSIHLWGLSTDAVRITADHAREISEGLGAA